MQRCKHSLAQLSSECFAVKDWSQSPTLALQRDLGTCRICRHHGHHGSSWSSWHCWFCISNNSPVEHGWAERRAVGFETKDCTTVGTDIVWHRPSVSGRWRRDNLSFCPQHLRLSEAAERRHVRLRRRMIQSVTICHRIMGDMRHSCWDGSGMFRYELDVFRYEWWGSSRKQCKVRISSIFKENLHPRPLKKSTVSLPPSSSGSLVPRAMQQLHSYDGHRTLCSVEDKATAGRLGGHSWNIISNSEQAGDLTCLFLCFLCDFHFSVFPNHHVDWICRVYFLFIPFPIRYVAPDAQILQETSLVWTQGWK